VLIFLVRAIVRLAQLENTHVPSYAAVSWPVIVRVTRLTTVDPIVGLLATLLVNSTSQPLFKVGQPGPSRLWDFRQVQRLLNILAAEFKMLGSGPSHDLPHLLNP
jgi:hypothetical protein